MEAGLEIAVVLTDDEITGLQLAVQAGDLNQVRDLISGQSPETLTGLQLFADHTLLMYACEHSTPEVVKCLLEQGTGVSELEWSTNNELKSALRNSKHNEAILKLVLPAVPQDLRADMIEGDWDPDDIDEGNAKSPLQMAAESGASSCLEELKSWIR